MPLIGALGAGAAMGLLISALGAGGSLSIVPVLIYLFQEPLSRATGTSLVIVCAAASVGALGHARKGNVRPRVAIVFGGASMLGAVAGAALHPLVSDRVLLVMLALTLLAAAARMVWAPRGASAEGIALPPWPWRVAPIGLLVGALTGFLGVGGGFVIVPALIWGARLSMREAIGTSLTVIALSSATGAVSHALQGHVSTTLLASVGAGAVMGALAGAPLSGRIPERPLRLGFAALATGTAAYILLAR